VGNEDANGVGGEHVSGGGEVRAPKIYDVTKMSVVMMGSKRSDHDLIRYHAEI
jgi:hypothetical protein